MKDYKPAALMIFILALADNACGMLFPIDYTYQSMSYVPLFSLGMLLIFERQLTWKEGIIVAASTGLFMDLFFYQTFPVHMLLYTLLSLGQIFFGQWVESRRLRLLFSLFLVFMSQFIPYIIQYFLRADMIPVHLWFWKMELLTVLINGAGLLCLEEIWETVTEILHIRQEKKIRDSIRI